MMSRKKIIYLSLLALAVIIIVILGLIIGKKISYEYFARAYLSVYGVRTIKIGNEGKWFALAGMMVYDNEGKLIYINPQPIQNNTNYTLKRQLEQGSVSMNSQWKDGDYISYPENALKVNSFGNNKDRNLLQVLSSDNSNNNSYNGLNKISLNNIEFQNDGNCLAHPGEPSNNSWNFEFINPQNISAIEVFFRTDYQIDDYLDRISNTTLQLLNENGDIIKTGIIPTLYATIMPNLNTDINDFHNVFTVDNYSSLNTTKNIFIQLTPTTDTQTTTTTSGETTTTSGETTTTSGETTTTSGETTTTSGETTTTSGETTTTSGETTTTSGETTSTMATPTNTQTNTTMSNPTMASPTIPMTTQQATTTLPMTTIPMTTIPMTTKSNSVAAANSYMAPATNIMLRNFDGTSNVFAPYLYYKQERFEPFNSLDSKYASY